MVNLDPATENIPYVCDINVVDLVSLEDVMEELKLGPNGGMIYCLEFLLTNREWLFEKIEAFLQQEAQGESSVCFLFDLPGQVELYTHSTVVKRLIGTLQTSFKERKRELRLAAVNLIDSFHCIDPYRFISVLVLSLSTMLRLELPHINLLSKFDLIDNLYETTFSQQSEKLKECEISRVTKMNEVAKNYQNLDASLSFLLDMVPEKVRDLVYGTVLIDY